MKKKPDFIQFTCSLDFLENYDYQNFLLKSVFFQNYTFHCRLVQKASKWCKELYKKLTKCSAQQIMDNSFPHTNYNHKKSHQNVDPYISVPIGHVPAPADCCTVCTDPCGLHIQCVHTSWCTRCAGGGRGCRWWG